MHRPYAHCPHCGAALPETDWPRRCDSCGQFSYLSPAVVGVVLQPVDDGLLIIQRGIRPHKRKWALPGGFIDAYEGWQTGCARELFEETGVQVPAEAMTLFSIENAPQSNMILIFAVGPPLTESALPPFVKNDECLNRRVMRVLKPLAFPLHTEAARRYLDASPS